MACNEIHWTAAVIKQQIIENVAKTKQPMVANAKRHQRNEALLGQRSGVGSTRGCQTLLSPTNIQALCIRLSLTPKV
jgi:hypothetical protein